MFKNIVFSIFFIVFIFHLLNADSSNVINGIISEKDNEYLSNKYQSPLSLKGETINWNDATKIIFYKALGEVPVAGSILGGLVEIFWPSSGSIWDEIMAQVEEIVQEAISDEVYEHVSEDLEGLESNLNEYNSVLKNSPDNLAHITDKFDIAKGDFLQQLPHFQEKGQEVRLLPLFAQMMNLYLGLLRDGVLFGKDWGWTDAEVDRTEGQLTSAIKEYTDYANKWYTDGLKNLKHSNPERHKNVVLWGETNRYKREYTLGVLDYLAFWQYLDPVKYPDSVDKKTILSGLKREIYSDPVGVADDSTMSVDPAPVEKITALSIWAWDAVDAVKVKLGDAWGPRMGDQPHPGWGGSNEPPHGWNGSISPDNPIVRAFATAGDYLNGMSITFKDGTDSGLFGGGGSTSLGFSYSDHILSNIKIMGVSGFYGTADCIVFAFRYEDSY